MLESLKGIRDPQIAAESNTGITFSIFATLEIGIFLLESPAEILTEPLLSSEEEPVTTGMAPDCEADDPVVNTAPDCLNKAIEPALPEETRTSAPVEARSDPATMLMPPAMTEITRGKDLTRVQILSEGF